MERMNHAYAADLIKELEKFGFKFNIKPNIHNLCECILSDVVLSFGVWLEQSEHDVKHRCSKPGVHVTIVSRTDSTIRAIDNYPSWLHDECFDISDPNIIQNIVKLFKKYVN